MTTEKEINDLFQDVYDTLNSSLQALKTGQPVDPSALQEKAKYLCEQIATLPARDAKTFEPQLKEISKHFASISNTLQEQQNVLQEDISDHDHRNKARSAYRNASFLRVVDNDKS